MTLIINENTSILVASLHGIDLVENRCRGVEFMKRWLVNAQFLCVGILLTSMMALPVVNQISLANLLRYYFALTFGNVEETWRNLTFLDQKFTVGESLWGYIGGNSHQF